MSSRLCNIITEKIKGNVIVDVGCGSGLTKSIIERAGYYVGIDINYNELQKGRQIYQNYSNVDFIQSDVRYLPLRNSCTATILSVLMFHEFYPAKDISEVVKEIYRILACDGVFILVDKFVYNPSNEAEKNSIIWEVLHHEVMKHLLGMELWGLHHEKDYIKLLKDGDLKIIDKVYIDRPDYFDYDEFLELIIKHSRTARILKGTCTQPSKKYLESKFEHLLRRVKKFGYKKSKVIVIIAKK